MFEKKGSKCTGCQYINVNLNAKLFTDRTPCINCSRLYYDYYKRSETDNIPDNMIKCIYCGKIVEVSRGLRKSDNPRLGICRACFNKT